MSRRPAAAAASASASSVPRSAAPPPGTKGVDPLHAFPLDALLPYLRQHVAGFSDALRASGKEGQGNGAVDVYQFSHGQSNPTFALQISDGEGRVLRRYVLRKKPKGKLLPSAHAIEREFRIMTALRGSNVPVPHAHCLCTDAGVIGTPFFVMAFVPGRIFKDVTLPGMDRAQRFAIYAEMARVLAALHSVDPAAVGLADYGPRENFIGRQVKRWSAQYSAAKTDDLPAMDALIRALEARVPAPDDAEGNRLSIVHGDFRLDNLVFHPREPRCVAVLDWELSSLGHPVADLAYNCMPYFIPTGIPDFPGLHGQPLSVKGFPTEAQYVRAYARHAGRCGPIQPEQWRFMLALSFFRSASILQGVYKRSLQGNASQSDQSGAFRAVVPRLVDLAAGVLEGRVVPHGDAQAKFEQMAETQSRAALNCFKLSDGFWPLHKKVSAFIADFVVPNEPTFAAQHAALKAAHGGDPWHVPPIMEELKALARQHGLWNLFFTRNKAHGHSLGLGLTNVEYAPLCELMGRSVHMAPEIFNCRSDDARARACCADAPTWPYDRLVALASGGWRGRAPRPRAAQLSSVFSVCPCCVVWAIDFPLCSAPDTGNMEVLANYGTAAQKAQWLEPLMAGKIRSCFAMTEPGVASSDATNIECTMVRDGDHYVINGRKWYISGASDPRCAVAIVMGKTDSDPAAPKHKAQSMILVPMNTPGVKIIRPMQVFGYDDAPHGHAEMVFADVRVPATNILLGEGRGFEIAQGRLGPGRIHHCFRLIGMAERALEEMLTRALTRTAFGGALASKGAMLKDIADSRVEIDACRMLCLQAAAMMDTVGNKLAAQQIGMIKVLAPTTALSVIDRAIQAQGARGVSQDTHLPWMWAGARSLRLADGPDEVHRENIAKLELLKAKL